MLRGINSAQPLQHLSRNIFENRETELQPQPLCLIVGLGLTPPGGRRGEQVQVRGPRRLPESRLESCAYRLPPTSKIDDDCIRLGCGG